MHRADPPRQGWLRLDWLAAACAAGLGLAVFALLRERGFDDAYITYVYAANLARGAGLVFNPGELVLSTTTPLLAIMLGGAARLGLDIPLTSTALGSMGIAAGAWSFWRLGETWHMRWAGAAGLLLYPLQGLLLATLGNEMGLALGAMLLGFSCAARGQAGRAMTLAGLSVLARPDGLIAAGLVLACAVWALPRTERLAGFARGAAALAAMCAPWLVFAWMQYGAPWPATLAAKRAQGGMAISRSFASGVAGILRQYVTTPAQWPATVLVATGAWVALWRRAPWLWLAAWSGAFAIAYSVLGVSAYFWYFAPLVPGLVACAAVGAHTMVDAGMRVLRGRPARMLALGALVVLALATPARTAITLSRQNDMRLGPYRLAGEWLRANTPEAASVGMLEVGVIGYYAHRRVIDFAGLLQPDVTAQIQPNRTYDDLALYAWEHYQPDYLVIFEQQFPGVRATPRFMRDCREAARFAGPPALLIYACP